MLAFLGLARPATHEAARVGSRRLSAARLAPALALAGTWWSISGCSSHEADPPLSFAAQPDMVVTGSALSVEVRASPDPPWEGIVAIELTVTNIGEATAQDGLNIAMVPWMPAHDHGTSLVPVVTAESNGKYLVTDVDFFMAGHWELQTTFSGSAMDYVAPAYDVQ